MLVTKDKNEVRYVAIDGQTDFIFDFPVLSDTHLSVFDGEVVDGETEWTQQTLHTDFEMVITDTESQTGNVVFYTGRTAAHKILILRKVPLTQMSEYQEEGMMPAKTIETDFNLSTMTSQQLNQQLRKCAKLSDTSEIEDLTLGEPKANHAVGWNETADGLETGPTFDEIADASDHATNALAARDEAVTANTEAQEARTVAVAARDVAVASEAVAVGARDDAQLSADYLTDYQRKKVAMDLERDSLDNYAWGVSDAAGKVAFGITPDGGVEITKFGMRDANVPMDGLSERDDLELIWAVRDTENKAAFGITPEGALSFANARMPVAVSGRDKTPYMYAIGDKENRAALGITPDGAVDIAKLVARDLSAPAAVLADRDDISYVWTIRDRNGNAALGVTDAGAVTFSPSDATLRAIETDRYYAPADFSEEFNTFNIRELASCFVASRCDDEQFVFDVRRLKESEAGAAVIEHHGKLLFLPFGGQSNSGQGGSTGVSFPDAAYPHNCLTFANAAQKQGEVAAVESEFMDLKQVRDASWDGQFPATMASFALESSLRESTGQTGQGTLCFTAWYPGVPLEDLVRGTVPFENIMVAARRAPVVAARYGKDCECPFYTFVHGEAGPYPYYDDFVAYAADIAGEIATQMGQVATPEFVFLQINNRDYDTAATGVEQDQLDAAVDYHGNGLTLAGPMYHCPFADYIHQTPEGRMLVGEMLAECYRTILAGEQFTPLWPTFVTRTDAVIDITFAVPGNGLALDTDWVPTVPDQGFVYEDDASSAAISTVEIVGTDTVRITLDAVPTGTNKQIHYAKATGTFADGWANGRGLLYSPTDRESFYHQRGFDIPQYLRHYAVRFTEEVV